MKKLKLNKKRLMSLHNDELKSVKGGADQMLGRDYDSSKYGCCVGTKWSAMSSHHDCCKCN